MTQLEPLLREMAVAFPDRLAIQCRDRRLTYQQLLYSLDALTDQLGQTTNMRIILLLPDGIASYLCHLRFFLDGAVVVPVTTQATTAGIRALCQKVRPHLIVTNSPLRMRHAAALQGLACLAVQADEADAPSGVEFDTIGMETFVARREQCSDPAVTDLRLLVFTSGSTGDPKGVCLSEANILAAAGMNVSSLSLDSLRKSLVTVPLYDYYGFIQIYSHLLAGTGYIFGESIAFPEQIFRRIRNGDVTDLVLVPHTLREILRLSRGARLEVLKKLQYITSSSDVLTAKLLEDTFAANPELKVFNIYGLTEAGRACYRKIEASSQRSGSIGRPAPGVEIIIDSPHGELGEIVIRGPNVMRGYFEGIEANQVTFKACTEMRTGDLGFYDDNGEIVLAGRRDHMLNIKGAKIHPAEIERIALQIPGVAEALAQACVQDGGQRGICLDIVTVNGTCDMAAIRAHLRRNLLPAFFPAEVNIVSALKRTELGFKVIRKKEVT